MVSIELGEAANDAPTSALKSPLVKVRATPAVDLIALFVLPGLGERNHVVLGVGVAGILTGVANIVRRNTRESAHLQVPFRIFVAYLAPRPLLTP